MSVEKHGTPYWLALLRAPGVGAVKYRQLLERCGEPQALFDNPALCDDARLRGYLREPDWEAVEGD
jgi:DNA processing protein